MPGHVKLGQAGEPDPDPLPYLVVDIETKRADMAKPYDSKKSVWVPDNDGGFVEALLDSEAGGKTTVMCGHEKKTFKSEQVGQVNPPKFEQCEIPENEPGSLKQEINSEYTKDKQLFLSEVRARVDGSYS